MPEDEIIDDEIEQLKCPACGAPMEHKSQYWSCEECPFIAFEYWSKGDAHIIADEIEAYNDK